MNCSCPSILEEHEETVTQPPSTAAAWGFGILSALVMSIVSLCGVAVFYVCPARYKQPVMQFMLGFSFGAMVAATFLDLLPETVEAVGGFSQSVGVTVLGGILFGWAVQLIVHSYGGHQHSSHSNEPHGPCHSHFHSHSTISPDRTAVSIELGTTETGKSSSTVTTASLSETRCGGLTTAAILNSTGDLLCNFVDGLLIGASFQVSLHQGWIAMFAILAHELPQEMGDFAVLISSGLSMTRALVVNFVVSLTCLLGVLVGLGVGSTVGEDVHYILALSGGIFLYLSLACVAPLLMQAAQQSTVTGPSVSSDSGVAAKISSPTLMRNLAAFGILLGGGSLALFVNLTHEGTHEE